MGLKGLFQYLASTSVMLLVLEPSFQKTMSASQSIAPLVPARAPRKPSSDLAWSLAQVSELFELPFNDQIGRAHV